MKLTTTSNPLLDEQVSFIQHALPGLTSGDYQLTVEQQIKDESGTVVSDNSITNTYKFAVLGDQFSLQNPTGTIYSVFPADNTSGEYTTILPHVVFSKPTFPWMRYPTNTPPVSGLTPGEDTEANVPTWLAILTLDNIDVDAFPGLQLAPKNATIGDLYPPALYPQSTLGSNYSYFWNAASATPQLGTSLTDTIQVLDIPLALFWQIAPTLADLQQLAHVREVSLTDKATMPGISDVGEPLGKFSIVFGNRLPQTEQRSVSFLVSLEMMQNFLPNNDGTMPSTSPTTDGTKILRLAVLSSWTFFSTGQPATFTDQLLALNGRSAGSTSDAVNTNLRLNYSGSNQLVSNIISMGYVPLNHCLRTSEKTVSWYRGPLLPYKIQTVQLSFPIASPDQATVFDPTTGMLDTSYATAWTIGRLIALQDTAFSTALYTWKKGLTQQIVNAAEEQIMGSAFSPMMQQMQAPKAKGRKRAVQAPQPVSGSQLLHHIMQLVRNPNQK